LSAGPSCVLRVGGDGWGGGGQGGAGTSRDRNGSSRPGKLLRPRDPWARGEWFSGLWVRAVRQGAWPSSLWGGGGQETALR